MGYPRVPASESSRTTSADRKDTCDDVRQTHRTCLLLVSVTLPIHRGNDADYEMCISETLLTCQCLLKSQGNMMLF